MAREIEEGSEILSWRDSVNGWRNSCVVIWSLMSWRSAVHRTCNDYDLILLQYNFPCPGDSKWQLPFYNNDKLFENIHDDGRWKDSWQISSTLSHPKEGGSGTLSKIL